ncbi:hypothetical protein IGI04_011951 [Brassica rapa subsp. trilocularis]|uniref:MD-2-related lipid-recognition domain-containing protein n=1 Tax=Brassica rapa subsp. trilocularis TaxID=1813537 RepID=A0ABQ7N4L9_BRACM|nr:hypothetical protein IGI04_011951 [Brassica rapa subsp. trilocularis]
MEKPHSQPLFLLLLVSLFFLPAAMGSRLFTPCNQTQYYPVYVETVEIYPHPINRSGNGEIWVTGYTGVIPDEATVVVNVSAPRSIRPYVSIKTFPICDTMACPVRPGPFDYRGLKFSMNIRNAFIPKELNSVINTVTLSIKVEQEPIMCVVFSLFVLGRRPQLT